MGSIRSLINTTPDGFADGRHVIVDAEFYEFTHGLLADTQTIAFGRNTFELFQDRWTAILKDKTMQEWQVKMARALNDKHKTVFSSTLKTTFWNNATIEPSLHAEQLNACKQEGKGGVLTFGSMDLVSSLTAMDLIDDYYFCIQPLIAGHGDVRLFDKIKLDASRPLIYRDSHQLKSGVHIIHYQRAH